MSMEDSNITGYVREDSSQRFEIASIDWIARRSNLVPPPKATVLALCKGLLAVLDCQQGR
jgi:hypothetical protein